MTSGTGVASSKALAVATGAKPHSRARPCHSASQSNPATNSANVPSPMAGLSFTEPGWDDVKCASASRPSSDLPASHQAGAPSPTISHTSAIAINGIDTKVTSGIASTLAKAPYSPARWKWNSTIGISASSITMPVTSSMTLRLPNRDSQLSSRGARKRFTHAALCSATMAITAEKLIWKLGPTRDSGHRNSTNAAATATMRRLSGSRPSASAMRTSTAPTQLRTVGTCAPVNKV